MDEESLFGHSLRLTSGDISFTDGDLRKVGGRENLVQALLIRILTPYATDPFNATYGFDHTQAFSSTRSVGSVKELIKLNLVRSIATDGRVTDVREIAFMDEPRYRELHPTLSDDDVRRVRTTRRWLVDVIVSTVDGEPQTVNVEIG